MHRGEDWPDNFQAIKRYALKVREQLAPEKPFGLGLRLSAQAVWQLTQPGVLTYFKQFLDENQLYVFTINGFPYGNFHSERVKEEVYKPDWFTQERFDYTLALIHVLAELLPQHLPGSISTVPGAYCEPETADRDRQPLYNHLAEIAYTLYRYHQRYGKEIVLAIEPEPDCYLGSTAEAIRFFKEELFPAARTYLAKKYRIDGGIISRYVGICFDACHAAVEFEDPVASLQALQAAGIRLGKIQLSAAVKAPINPQTIESLRHLCEPVYLHQSRCKVHGDAELHRFRDLSPEVLQTLVQWQGEEVRTHFHVPVYFQEHAGLFSTSDLLSPSFLRACINSGVMAYELETYTFDVLPASLKTTDPVASIVAEYRWITERFKNA